MTLLCAAPTCHVLGWHDADCTDQKCRGCLPARADAGQLCQHCLGRLEDILDEIPRLYAALDLEPGRGEPAPLGRAGATSRPPVRVDILNEIGPGSPHVTDPDRLQEGELPAAVQLDLLVRDWASYTGEDDALPIATVPQLALWLRTRVGWAGTHHPAVREFYGELSGLRGRLRPLVNGVELTQWTGRLPGRCPACRHLSLTAERGRAECHHPTCQRVWVDEATGVR